MVTGERKKNETKSCSGLSANGKIHTVGSVVRTVLDGCHSNAYHPITRVPMATLLPSSIDSIRFEFDFDAEKVKTYGPIYLRVGIH